MDAVLGPHQHRPAGGGNLQIGRIVAGLILRHRRRRDEGHVQGPGLVGVDLVDHGRALVEPVPLHARQADPVDGDPLGPQGSDQILDPPVIGRPPARAAEGLHPVVGDDALLVVGAEHDHRHVDGAAGDLLLGVLLDVDVVVAGQARGRLAELDHRESLVVAQLMIEAGPEAVAQGVAENPHHQRSAHGQGWRDGGIEGGGIGAGAGCGRGHRPGLRGDGAGLGAGGQACGGGEARRNGRRQPSLGDQIACGGDGPSANADGQTQHEHGQPAQQPVRTRRAVEPPSLALPAHRQPQTNAIHPDLIIGRAAQQEPSRAKRTVNLSRPPYRRE